MAIKESSSSNAILKTIDFSNTAIDELGYSTKEWCQHVDRTIGNEPFALIFKKSCFDRLTNDDLISLVGAIGGMSNLVAIDLSDNPFFLTFDEKKIAELMDCMFNSTIKCVNLGQTNLVSVGSKLLSSVFGNLSKGIIDSLDLSHNNLLGLSEIDMDLLFKAIENSQVTTLNLSGNNLGYLDNRKFSILCDHLKNSNVIHLNIDGNHFSGIQKKILKGIVAEKTRDDGPRASPPRCGV